MTEKFDKAEASSTLKNLLKINDTPAATTVDLKKKNTNRSAILKTKEGGHGPLQPQSIKYSEKSGDTITNKHNNERLNYVNPSRTESARESQKGNTSSNEGRSFRKEKQNYREHASFSQKKSKSASSTSSQNSASDSHDTRDVTNSQRYSSSMRNQKHSAEDDVRKSYDSADSSRKNNSRNPPVENQRMDKPFRNTDDRRDYRDKSNSSKRKESRNEKYHAQESDGKKQMNLGAEKQNKPDIGNPQESAKSEEDKLTKEFLLSLKENKIKYLPKKNPRFPKANYLCTLCDFHLNIEADCSKHLTDPRHLRRKKLHDEDAVLRSIPKPKERQFAALTAAVEKVYTEHGISVEEKKQRADAVLRLEKILKEKIPDVELYMYGSSLTGFGMKNADINVNLTSTDKNKKLTTLLKETFVGIKDRTDCGFSNVRPDFTAKVPGLYVTDDVTGLTLSIAIHCYKAHCTSQLLSIYSDFDIRVSKLAVAFRYWAHLCQLDRHLDGFMPPQAFNLMVIYFLQQMSPQMVPIIKPPEVTGEETGDYKKDSPAFEKMRAKVMKFSAQTRNTMSVGELWFRLLRFYCLEFDTPNSVVSIRTDQQVPRNTKPWNSKKLAVEDPYMLKKNVTGMVNLPHVCEYWEDCIRLALHYFGFPRDAEGKSYIPIDAFVKMIQYNESLAVCPPAEINQEDKANKQPAADNEPVPANTKDKLPKTQYSKGSQRQTLTKDDQSSLDSGRDVSDSDTEDSDDDDDDESVSEDQKSSIRDNLHKQSSATSPAGSNSQMKSTALTKQGNLSTMSLKKQALKHDISDSGISDGLSQTPDNGYIPHQAQTSNKSFGVKQQVTTREPSASSSHNDSKGAVINSPTGRASPEKESQTDSSYASQRLSVSSLGTPAEEATDDNIDHLKLTEAMNDIFLLLEQRECYYVFSKEGLTDGKGPVLLCTYCEKVGHLKNACPDDKLPEIFPLPPLTALHIRVLSETLSRVPGFVGLCSFGSSNRVSFLKDLEAFIRTHFDDANLTLFGSSCNGFGFEKSDMDICLTFSQRKVIDKPWVIESLARKMKQFKDVIKVQAITTAKVPIVKFTVRSSGLEGDISLYNILAQHNTRLLLCYSQIDPRVRILGYAIKYFAKVCDIGDASRGSLSSYAYVLMMIYYLQQVSPPVVPVLQELYEGKQKPQVIVEECDVWFMDDLKKLNTLWSDKGRNKMSPAELWVGFLRFYVEEFNSKEIVVSIRQKEPVTRFDKLWNGENIAIEDPFDHSHNLGSGLTRNMNNFIFKTFINGRMLHGSPIDNNMELFKKYRNPFDYFFDPELLSESRPPNVRGCHFCGKMGHLARQCPLRKAQDQQNKQQKPFQQQQQQLQQKPEVQQQSYPILQQHGNQQKSGQSSQVHLKQPVSLAQSVQQGKQLLDSTQPNLPSQERPQIQQLPQNKNIQVQQESKQTLQAEPVQPKQPETKELLQQEQQQYERPLEKQQNQRQVLHPQQEDRRQPFCEQQQTLQPKQHQKSQDLQVQQPQRQPLLHQPVQLVQQQDHQVQSSHQSQLPQTQQIEHFNRQPSQTNQQNMQPFQPPQQQQRQPPHQQQVSQSMQPQQQFRPPFQHQMRHPAVSQQEKHAFHFQHQPSQPPPQRQNQYPQQRPPSQQQRPQSQQPYHHSQPQNYHQQQLQQPAKVEAYDSKQEQNQSQKNGTGKINSSPEPASAFSYANNPAHPAGVSVMHSQVYHNSNYMQQRHHLHQNQHQMRGYAHNPVMLAPGTVTQGQMLLQHSNFNAFGNRQLLAHPNVMLQPGYDQPSPASHNPGRGYLPQASHNPGNRFPPPASLNPGSGFPPPASLNPGSGFPPPASHNPGSGIPPQASHNPGSGIPPQASLIPGNGYPTQASHNPGYRYPTQASHNPGNVYPTHASHNPGNGYPYNTMYNKGPQTTAGMHHSGGDRSLNGQFLSPAVQNMFDSAREQNG